MAGPFAKRQRLFAFDVLHLARPLSHNLDLLALIVKDKNPNDDPYHLYSLPFSFGFGSSLFWHAAYANGMLECI
jgi:hypothetical protein